MKLTEVLAIRCIQVKRAALDPATAREEFEDLGAKERVALSQADRFKAIAKSRAKEEADKSPLDTATERLWPMPHTGTEALVRTPLVGAGAAMGQRFMADREMPDVAGIRELADHGVKERAAVPAPASTPLSEIGTTLEARLRANGHPASAEAAAHIDRLVRSDPQRLAHLLSKDQSGAYINAAAAGDVGKHFKGRNEAALQALEAELGYHGFQHETAGGVSAFKHKGKGGLQPAAGGQGPQADHSVFPDLVKKFNEPKSGLKVPGAEKTVGEELGTLGKAIAARLHAKGHSDPTSAARRVEALALQNPELFHTASGHRPDWLVSNEARGVRSQLSDMTGGLGHKLVQEEQHQLLNRAGGAGIAARMATGNKWKRVGGALGGAAIGSVLTGLPLAIRALHQRRHGGEAAVRAKKRVDEELNRASQASKRRDEIVGDLKK